MGYQTGVANNINDLLDKFRLFAVDEGWSVNRWSTVGSGRELCIEKGTMFFNFRSVNGETTVINGSSGPNRFGLNINGSDGFSSGAAWDRQPGYPLRTSSWGGDQGHAFVPTFLNAGPYAAYHFFAPDNKTLYGVIEITTGRFLHFGCGALDLFNPAAPGGGRFFFGTGGQYPSTSETASNAWLQRNVDDAQYALELVPGRGADYAGTSGTTLPGSFLRAAFGSFNNWCHSNRTNAQSVTPAAWQGGGVHDKPLYGYNPAPLNSRTMMTPNVAAVNRNDEFLQPVGVFNGLRYMMMDNFLPGDEFTFGSDTWKVFPWFQKGGLSYERGIAFKKVD